MKQTIEYRVIQVIAKAQKISPDAISLNQPIEELCQDSLDLVNLLFELEDEFDLSIPDDVKTSKTVGDIVKELEAHLRIKEESETTTA